MLFVNIRVRKWDKEEAPRDKEARGAKWRAQGESREEA